MIEPVLFKDLKLSQQLSLDYIECHIETQDKFHTAKEKSLLRTITHFSPARVKISLEFLSLYQRLELDVTSTNHWTS